MSIQVSNGRASVRARNIVISGTNFWNPGDDFVRDGVIAVIKELFSGDALNFLFYNFNADFFPQNKFSGIANYAAEGDLNKYRDFVDAVVIAGLSAGNEIKDLYQWILANGLEDRVYLIGAGYENGYVARHIESDPEATIFRNARVVLGRTRKTPEFIARAGVPYHHINCPAILSVPEVKPVSPDRQIERIGFSIQLPQGVGLVNHTCPPGQYQLATTILADLAKAHSVEVIAHHKTEYFHFLDLLRDTGVPVLFSSFYQDLFQIYPRYDVVVTTRLHSSLFANGHGIPGIIVNDTDRHTHTLEGFPHSSWVNTREDFDREFTRIRRRSLAEIAAESETFKRELKRKYISLLREPFTRRSGPRGTSRNPAADYSFDSERKEQALVRSLVGPGMTVLDVGANIGKYTKLFSLLVGSSGRVFAFEPDPDSARRVREMVARDSLANVTVVEAAVCEHSGTVTLNRFPAEYSSWNSLGRPQMKDPRDPARFVPLVGRVEARAVTLDEFCREHGIERVDYLKLDVEGAELRALQGAKKLIERKAVALLQFEVSQKMLEGLNTTARPVFDLLKAAGFECRTILESGAMGELAGDSSAFYENYIAQPRADASRDANGAPLLPVHFFTIVLNGKPFIDHHIEVFRKLPFAWHWHIVEGVAELAHDTAWSKKFGGKITGAIHCQGLSNDGTTEYLDELARKFPQNITVHRKPGGAFWDGKLEMVNAPLSTLHEECLLWQIDVDELWTTAQIIRAREMFLAAPERTAAFYFCRYFVGEGLVITSRNTYGNNTGYEWIRTWRFTPGCKWTAHEPPRLCRPSGNGDWMDLAAINPFRHDATERAGLIFQHFAYAAEQQLRFKEIYYGYTNAVAQWEKLQEAQAFPVALRDYFAWVKDGAVVNTAGSQGVVPIARRDASGPWSFHEPVDSMARRILFVRTDSIGDCVLASSMLPHLRRRFPAASIAVLCQEHIAELFTACPEVSTVICFDRKSAMGDDAYRKGIIAEIARFNPELVLNSIYSTDALAEVFTLSHRAPQTIGLKGDLSNIDAADRDHAHQLYTRLIPSPGEASPELERHRDFLAGLGIEAPALKPIVWTTAHDDAVADTFFQENGFDPATTVALFPSSKHAIKDYPKFAEALQLMGRGFRYLILGGAEVETAGNDLAPKLPGTSINLAGKTTLRETAALIRRCRLLVGSDSSGAHLACAVGTPNVVVLGGGHFGRFLPYSELTSIACLPLDCYGCNWSCRHPRAHCVKDVAPEVVAEAIRQALSRRGNKPRVFVEDRSLDSLPTHGPRQRPLEDFLIDRNVEIVSVNAAQSVAAASSSQSAPGPDLLRALHLALGDGQIKRRVHDIVGRLERDLRQQHHEAGHAKPLRLAGRDELVDHDLGAVDEVAELRLPEHERVRLGEGVAVLVVGLRPTALNAVLRLAKIPEVLLQGHAGFRPDKGIHKTRRHFGIERRALTLDLGLRDVSSRPRHLHGGMVCQRHFQRLIEGQHRSVYTGTNRLTHTGYQRHQDEAVQFHHSGIHPIFASRRHERLCSDLYHPSTGRAPQPTLRTTRVSI
jgi:FkbM family methyltransferase